MTELSKQGVMMSTGEQSRRKESTGAGARAWITTGSLLVAAVLLLASLPFPYWRMVLDAPQYPGGLEMRVFVNRVTGDEDPTLDEVREIDGLNHYIGMRSLYDAARVERAIALPAVFVMAGGLVVAALVRRRWTWLLALPAVGFPFIFLGDLAFWLNNYGQNLDPTAPLSSAIQPFTPPILGEGIIGQFKTVASVETGWLLAVGAAALALIGLVLRLTQGREAA
ncbi:MAG: hypothetical protein Kow0077_28490 [Anaerolineae bacterium]